MITLRSSRPRGEIQVVSAQVKIYHGDNKTANAISETLYIENQNLYADVLWSAVPSEPWVELSASTGTTAEEIVVTFSNTGLSKGTHLATITFTSASIPEQRVVITVEVEILAEVYLPLVVRD